MKIPSSTKNSSKSMTDHLFDDDFFFKINVQNLYGHFLQEKKIYFRPKKPKEEDKIVYF